MIDIFNTPDQLRSRLCRSMLVCSVTAGSLFSHHPKFTARAEHGASVHYVVCVAVCTNEMSAR